MQSVLEGTVLTGRTSSGTEVSVSGQAVNIGSAGARQRVSKVKRGGSEVAEEKSKDAEGEAKVKGKGLCKGKTSDDISLYFVFPDSYLRVTSRLLIWIETEEIVEYYKMRVITSIYKL